MGDSITRYLGDTVLAAAPAVAVAAGDAGDIANAAHGLSPIWQVVVILIAPFVSTALTKLSERLFKSKSNGNKV